MWDWNEVFASGKAFKVQRVRTGPRSGKSQSLFFYLILPYLKLEFDLYIHKYSIFKASWQQISQFQGYPHPPPSHSMPDQYGAVCSGTAEGDQSSQMKHLP